MLTLPRARRRGALELTSVVSPHKAGLGLGYSRTRATAASGADGGLRDVFDERR